MLLKIRILKPFTVLGILFVLLLSCFFVPKVDQLAWRAASLVEFKLFRVLSRFVAQDVGNPEINAGNLASHRGIFSDTVAENSAQSIRLAALRGFRYIELDISFSKDHQPFIFHDTHLKYKTNYDQPTCEVYWQKIQTLTLSDNQKILSLDEFLTQFAHQFDGVILDIKGDNRFYEEKALSFGKIIRESEYLEKLFIIGVPCLLLSEIKNRVPESKVGCEDRGVVYNYLSGKDLISLHYGSQYSAIEAGLANKFNLDIILWTVNEKSDLEKTTHLENTIVLTDLHHIH